jgi:hypothetical protein
MPDFYTRDRPERASPRETKKASDFPARVPAWPRPQARSTCGACSPQASVSVWAVRTGPGAIRLCGAGCLSGLTGWQVPGATASPRLGTPGPDGPVSVLTD